VKLGIPVVHGSIFRFEGMVTVFDPKDGPTYRDMVPEPPPAELAPSCAEAGVLGVLPGIVGSIQAIETIKLILGLGDSLVGRLLAYDSLEQSFREYKVRPTRPTRSPGRTATASSSPSSTASACPHGPRSRRGASRSRWSAATSRPGSPSVPRPGRWPGHSMRPRAPCEVGARRCSPGSSGSCWCRCPGGVGVREAVFVAAAGSLDPGIAAATALAARLLFVIVDAAGALLGAFALRRTGRQEPPQLDERTLDEA
jgi:hypothetical protein